MTWYTKENCST